ncbi:MAG: histidine kinase dimerization/phospho-acceptor domain-containing protein, partial [Pseudomonadota bacterium]
MFAAAGLSRIEKLHSVISDSMLPVVFGLERVNHMSLELAEVARRFDRATNQDQIIKVASEFAAKEAEFLSAIDEVNALGANFIRADFTLSIARIETLTVEVRAIAQQKFDAQERYRRACDEIETYVRALRDVGDEARTTVSVGLEDRESDTTALDMFRRVMSARSGIDAIAARLEALDLATQPQEASAIYKLLSLEIRNLFQTISRAPKGDFRDSVAAKAVALYDAIEATNLYPNKKDSIELGIVEYAKQSELLSEVASLQKAAAGIAREQRNLTLARDLELTEMVRRYSSGLLVMALTAVVAAIILAVFVIDRQIARRLRVVDRKAALIGMGDYDKQPALGGRDEIADIDRSIERLRSLSARQAAIELRLREAKRFAEDTASSKAEFLAMMSHEIRTPLNAIMGMFQLLARADLPDRQMRRIENGLRSAQNLHHLLSNVLDASRLEAGGMELAPERFKLSDLEASIASALEGAIALSGKDLAYEVRMSGARDADLVADLVRVNQIATNLIDNAVRFTEAGEVAAHID